MQRHFSNLNNHLLQPLPFSFVATFTPSAFHARPSSCSERFSFAKHGPGFAHAGASRWLRWWRCQTSKFNRSGNSKACYKQGSTIGRFKSNLVSSVLCTTCITQLRNRNEVKTWSCRWTDAKRPWIQALRKGNMLCLTSIKNLRNIATCRPMLLAWLDWRMRFRWQAARSSPGGPVHNMSSFVMLVKGHGTDAHNRLKCFSAEQSTQSVLEAATKKDVAV